MNERSCHARGGCLGCQIHALLLRPLHGLRLLLLLLQVERTAMGRQRLVLLLLWLHGQLGIGAGRSSEAEAG